MTMLQTPEFTAANQSRSVARSFATGPKYPVPTPSEITPHPVYGLMSEDSVLQSNSIDCLYSFFKKAMRLVAEVEKNSQATDDEMSVAMAPYNAIFEAIKSLKITYASGIAKQLKAISEKLEFERSNSIEEALDVTDLRRLALDLVNATADIQPKKPFLPLTRGDKLTRAGLLFRYQAFLVEEIHTLSYELYGEPRYALQYIHFDDEVHKRCKSKVARRCDPFLDSTKLNVRAQAVLKSLRIDSVRARSTSKRLSRKSVSNARN